MSLNSDNEPTDTNNEPEQCNTDNVPETPSCNSVNHASEPVSSVPAYIEQSHCDENMQRCTYKSPSDNAYAYCIKYTQNIS